LRKIQLLFTAHVDLINFIENLALKSELNKKCERPCVFEAVLRRGPTGGAERAERASVASCPDAMPAGARRRPCGETAAPLPPLPSAAESPAPADQACRRGAGAGHK